MISIKLVCTYPYIYCLGLVWMVLRGLSVKALAGPCRTEPTIVTEVGLRRMTIFGTGFYNPIKKNEVIEVNYSH